MTGLPQSLRSEPFQPSTILLTGASGYVGGLIAAQLLTHSSAQLILPVREGSRSRLVERLRVELAAFGKSLDELLPRVRMVAWPGSDYHTDPDWFDKAEQTDLDEIIHCAGCLDYFDVTSLDAVNVRLTKHLIAIGKRIGVQRFTYISTAYSAGYVDDEIAEALASEPNRDPTHYTRSKRQAEHLVAASGLPWLVLRPSILIGEYNSGRYSGKRYGLYQQWMGLERLMTDRYHAVIHTVAPQRALNLLHQDFFQDAFGAVHAWVPNNNVCHITSCDDSSPTMRQLWDQWLQVVRPKRINYYPSMADVDLRSIDIRQRAYLTFAQVNLEIGTHPWRFARGWLELLSDRGLVLRDATLESVVRCQDRFVATSDTLAKYRARFSDQFPQRIHIEEVHPHVAQAEN